MPPSMTSTVSICLLCQSCMTYCITKAMLPITLDLYHSISSHWLLMPMRADAHMHTHTHPNIMHINTYTYTITSYNHLATVLYSVIPEQISNMMLRLQIYITQFPCVLHVCYHLH